MSGIGLVPDYTVVEQLQDRRAELRLQVRALSHAIERCPDPQEAAALLDLFGDLSQELLRTHRLIQEKGGV